MTSIALEDLVAEFLSEAEYNKHGHLAPVPLPY